MLRIDSEYFVLILGLNESLVMNTDLPGMLFVQYLFAYLLCYCNRTLS